MIEPAHKSPQPVAATQNGEMSDEAEPDSFALSVDVDIRHPAWADLEARLEAQAHAVAAHLKWPEAEVSLVLADDEFIASLNHDYRGKTGPTNVLSFPAQDFTAPVSAEALTDLPAPRLLGDIVLAYQTVQREAEGQQKNIAHHAQHLVTHGLLHLIGHDHMEADAAQLMEALETDILTGQGLPAPYRLPGDEVAKR